MREAQRDQSLGSSRCSQMGPPPTGGRARWLRSCSARRISLRGQFLRACRARCPGQRFRSAPYPCVGEVDERAPEAQQSATLLHFESESQSPVNPSPFGRASPSLRKADSMAHPPGVSGRVERAVKPDPHPVEFGREQASPAEFVTCPLDLRGRQGNPPWGLVRLPSGYKPASQDSRFGCLASNMSISHKKHRITTFCGTGKCGSASASSSRTGRTGCNRLSSGAAVVDVPAAAARRSTPRATDLAANPYIALVLKARTQGYRRRPARLSIEPKTLELCTGTGGLRGRGS